MKKSFAAPFRVIFPLIVKINLLTKYGCGVALLSFGCTNTQVRWDATRMRQDVMVYYNDQIMENLIKAEKKLPFVHVDITSLTSAGGSQITGTIGGGETTASTSSPGVMGALLTVSRAVTRPFSYTVSPSRSETLTITTTPALGAQALASSQAQDPTPNSSLEVTRTTEVFGPPKTHGEEGPLQQKTIEKAPRVIKPKTDSIYDLYERFARNHLSRAPFRPHEESYVPGTLKRWRDEGRTEYYFVANNDRKEYYRFCKTLFLKGQAGSLEKQVETTRAELETVKSQLATPSLQ